MATRRDVLQRKTDLRESLTSGWRQGSYKPGEPAPTVRELAGQYGLSRTVVLQVLQQMVEDGVLYTVPSVGTYFGQPPVNARQFYLVVFPYPAAINPHFVEVQAGFEESIAKRGGSCLSLTQDDASQYLRDGMLPALSGLFEMSEGSEPQLTLADSLIVDGVPYVRFARDLETEITTDCVAFDDFGGGEQAAHHLMQLGHRRIAFLGLHAAGTRSGFRYSVERERGWRCALRSAGIAVDSLSFCPDEAVDCNPESQVVSGWRLGRVLAMDSAITAVLSVNALATQGFCRALEESGTPGDRWPAIVSFDEDPHASGHVISTMKVPWRELGQQAASLLWERSHGQLTGAPEQRRISMRLIPRLTSHASWAGALDLAQIQRLSPSSPSQQGLPVSVKAA